jgi:hypothetical protein
MRRVGDDAGATTAGSFASTTTVGEVVAEVKLEPVGDSGTCGAATFRKAGALGAQVELGFSGLPKPGAAYYAQVHEDHCPNEQEGQNGDGHERAPDDELPGNIDYPVSTIVWSRTLSRGTQGRARFSSRGA